MPSPVHSLYYNNNTNTEKKQQKKEIKCNFTILSGRYICYNQIKERQKSLKGANSYRKEMIAMKNKKLLSAALALTCVLTAGACGGGNGSSARPASENTAADTTAPVETTPPATLKEEDKAAIEEIETDFEELENKTVRLLANFDLNPAAGKPIGKTSDRVYNFFTF